MLHHIETDRITIEMAVAPIALALAAHPKLESYDLSSLRYIMWCATPVTPSVAEAVTRRAGVNWVTAYGTSELVVIACNEIEGARLDTVGRPVPGVRLRIVSLEEGERCRRARWARSRRAGFIDGGLLAGFGYGRNLFGRLVPDGRRRIPDVDGWLDHRPRQGNDQGGVFRLRPPRSRQCSTGTRPYRTARCSDGPTRRMERPSSPR
jgi:acyl-CoA synthetase (AMP-forming)/AMP-acid ligase II